MLRTGTLARDTLNGTDGADEFFGLAGDDVMFGNGGADRFDGGQGRDSMIGGAGSDTMLGGEGDDTIASGSGADLVQGGDGADVIQAGGGADTIHGDDPDALARDGVSHDDRIFAGTGHDLVFGGLGNDEIHGEAGNDTISGGTDNGRLVWTGGAPAEPIKEEPIKEIVVKGLSFAIGGTKSDIKAGNPAVSVRVTEHEDGALHFTVTLDAKGKTVADLRGLFFQIGNEDLAATLVTKGDWVTGYKGAEDKIENLGGGANATGVKTGPFDFGIAFGTAGIGKDDVREASFILASEKGPLGLDLLAGMDFAARLTSVGEEGGKREDGLKLIGNAGEVTKFTVSGTDDAPPKAEPAEEPKAGEPVAEAPSPDAGATLAEIVIGDNLHGGDGKDSFGFAKGDGVDLIWDFQSGQDLVVVKGYSIADVDAFTFVSKVTNHIDAGGHEKLAIILDAAGDAIIFNDLGNRDSGAAAVRFDDGTLSVKDMLALATPATTAKAEEAVALEDVAARIAITNSWWGGFQGEITITARTDLTDWEVLLGTRWTINSVWNAQRGEATSTVGGMLIDLDDAGWNGVLAAGQTATIGFTGETGHAGVLAAQAIMDGLWIG